MAAATPDPVNTPMTYAQLMQEAEQQAQSEIQGQVAPLQAQADTLTSQQAGAHAQIGQEFNQLQPFVGSQAQQLESYENNALAMEQSIFQAAGTRMNQLKQQQAAEAQQLAQQIGGPVSAGEFTQTLAPYEAEMPAQAASGMLHGLGIAAADVGEAHQFAGQVFPALRTEQETNSDNYFRGQIKTLQDQITQTEAGKSALTNSKLTDLLNNERSFKLNVAQAAEQKLKDKRDWEATKKQLGMDNVRLNLSKKASALSVAGVTGKYKGKPTLAAQRQVAEIQHLNQQQKLEAQRMGISVAEFKARLQHSQESTALEQTRLKMEQAKAGMTVLDAAYDPTNGKPISMTTKQYIPKGSLEEVRAFKNNSAHYDAQRHQWYTYQHLTMTAKQWAQRRGYTGTTPVTDPNKLFHLVRSEVPGLSRKAVIQMVRAKTGQKNWSP